MSGDRKSMESINGLLGPENRLVCTRFEMTLLFIEEQFRQNSKHYKMSFAGSRGMLCPKLQ